MKGAKLWCDSLVTVIQESQGTNNDRVKKIHYTIYPPQTQSPGCLILLIITGCCVVLGTAVACQHLDISEGLIILW
jgi:hypothetical protein